MNVGDILNRAAGRLAERWNALGAAPTLDAMNAATTEICRELEIPDFIRDALVGQVLKNDAGLARLHAEAIAAAEGKPLPQLKAQVGDGLLDAARTAPKERRGPGLPSGDQIVSNVPGNTRKHLDAEGLAALKRLPEQMREAARKRAGAEGAEPVLDDDVLGMFRAQYRAITDVEPLCVKDLVALVRDHGSEVVQLHDRKIPIGVVCDLDTRVDEVALKTFVRSVLNALGDEGLLGDVALIGRYNNRGGQKASYEAAEKHPEVKRTGIMHGRGVFDDVAQVDQGVVFGTEKGEDSALFLDTVSRGFMIGLGGGELADKELRWFIQKNGERGVLAEGFIDLAGAKLEGISRVEDAAKQPIESGYALGKRIAQSVRDERRAKLESPFLRLAMEASPKQIVEVDQWAKATTIKYRIIRILNAVRKRLEMADIPPARITEQLAMLGVEIANQTFGIDNLAENAIWQKRAKEAFKNVGEDVARVMDDVSIDIMFASWFGVREHKKEASYFETTSAVLSDAMPKIELDRDHTFDVGQYAEIRLDLVTAAYLRSHDARPEIFLGTRDEMESYYRAKGYELSSDIADSNGTNYHLITKGATKTVVVNGVDSEARLTQVGALMTSMGVDPDKVVVRGDVERVRASNRNLLELHLAKMNMPIAAVVIGNKNDPVDEVARMAGVPSDAIKTTRMETVGPFRFQAIEVESAGQKGRQTILAFAPAYGELSEDLVQAAVTAGARNFMIAGAGGSLIQKDEIGAVHQITRSRYGDEVYDLEREANINMLAVPGAKKTENVFSPTPLEQTQAWAERQRAAGAGDVDQETFPVFRALAAAAKDVKLNVMTGLHQSDVVGSGALERGTVDTHYGPNVSKMARAFFQSLGISGVRTQDGNVAAIAGAKPGLIAKQELTTTDLSRIEIPLPDLGTIGDSQAVSSEQQFKGQKRVLEVFTNGFGANEREFLRETLRGLSSSTFWVVAQQSDPNHGELLDLAQKAGYETILVASDESVRNDAIQGSPTFVLKKPTEEEAKKTLDELVRDGKNDEYETNTAQHYRLHLGKFAPEKDRHGFIYSSLVDVDDIDEIAAEIRRESKQASRKIKAETAEHFAAAGKAPPRFWAIEDLKELFGDRKPILLSGASKKSIAMIPPEQQDEIRRLLEELAKRLDPTKYVLVTGGTDHGVEKMAHEIFSREGKKFDILGTITENTGGAEVATNIENLAICAINWFGMSRPVLRQIVEAFNGEALNIGGGEILKDHIMLALKLNLHTHLMDGPPGASTDIAREYPAHAFKDLKELAARLGLELAGL